MDDQKLIHNRKVAKERIVNQFGDLLKSTSLLVVDCGPELGRCVVTRNGDYDFFDVAWLKPEQVVTLAGRIE